MTILATIPSPTSNQIEIFGFPLRAYALCILAGILVAIWVASRRWMARGGKSGEVLDLALWAVPFGIVGGRLYHVISTPSPYFGENGDLSKIIAVWEGGLGIWGAISFGALGVWIGARRAGMRMSSIADSFAPALLLAQAIGRLGNWFNNELYGGPSEGWLALEIHRLDENGQAIELLGTYQPTFLYELVWNVAIAGLLIWLDARFRMGHGRVFAAYVALYCLGRFFIERMRTDHAELIFGQRFNVWTALIVGAAAAAYLIVVKGRRESSPYRDDRPAFVDEDGQPTKYAPSTVQTVAVDDDDLADVDLEDADLEDEDVEADDLETAEADAEQEPADEAAGSTTRGERDE